MGHELEASARALAVLRVLNRSTSNVQAGKPANRELRHRDTAIRFTAIRPLPRDTAIPFCR